MSTQTGIDTRLFVGGEHVDPEGGATFENRDPFTGEVVSEVAARNLMYRTPASPAEARFSMNHCLAAAIQDGAVTLATQHAHLPPA